MHWMRVWCGPVSSGKTKRAMHAARRLHHNRGWRVVAVRPAAARRKHEEPGWIVTKDGERWPCVDLASVEHALRAFEAADAAWWDEPMLFSELEEPRAFELVQELRRRMPVLVSGLGATSELGPFRTSMPRILAVADRVYWCAADCWRCQALDAGTRSWHLEGKAQDVEVGSEELYKPTCPDCHLELGELRAAGKDGTA